MNRRNIVQYKPKGPANIFAPTIRFNGKNGKKGYRNPGDRAERYQRVGGTYEQKRARC